jgi:DNA polymerase
MTIEAVIDFETRSVVPLKVHGAFVYTDHPLTEVMCLALILNGAPPVLWAPDKFADMIDWGNIRYDQVSEHWMLDAVLTADKVVAQYSMFEFLVWNKVQRRRFNWPELPMGKLHDTMAQLAYHALPLNLDQACQALDLPIKKDMEGHKAMLKLCKPRTPLKKEKEADPDWASKIWWNETPELIEKNFNYCGQDVEAEHLVHHTLGPIPSNERKIWLLDQKINLRGVQIDTDSVKAIVKTVKTQEASQLKSFQRLTQGAVSGPRSYVKLREWVNAQTGLSLKSIDKVATAKLIEKGALPQVPKPIRKNVQAVLRIKAELSKSSVAKFTAMLDRMSPDGRVRGWSTYHGATTGRWAARGLQLHNLPRDSYGPEDYEAVVKLFKQGDIEILKLLWDSPYFVASRCVRGSLIAGPGKQFYTTDFSSVESMGLAWLAGEEWVLQAYRDGKDLYKIAAAQILGKRYEDITKEERQTIGKPCELGFGFGGGIGAIRTMAKTYGLDLETLPALVAPMATPEELNGPWGAKALAKRYLAQNPGSMSLNAAIACDIVKRKWRALRPNIVRLWKQLESCAIQAIENPGVVYRYRTLSYCVANKFLMCQLPSGRVMHYYDPWIDYKEKEMPDGEYRSSKTICFMGMRVVDGKTTRQWTQLETYGGKVAENCISGDAEVLTYSRGWVPLRDFLGDELIWDGVEFVYGGKLVDKGMKPVIQLAGIKLTPDHRVLCSDNKWRSAYEITSPSQGLNWKKVLLPYNQELLSYGWGEKFLERCLRMRGLYSGSRVRDDSEEGAFTQVLWVHDKKANRQGESNARYVQTPGICGVAVNGRSMPVAHASSIPQLRGQRHTGLFQMAKKVREFLVRYGADLQKRFIFRPNEQRKGLFETKLQMGEPQDSGKKQEEQCIHTDPVGFGNSGRSVRTIRHKYNDDIVSDSPGVAHGQTPYYSGLSEPASEKVYDIVNCGPRNRFVVRAVGSEPIIVHNCTQGFCRDILAEAMLRHDVAGYPVCLDVHDEDTAEKPLSEGDLEEYNRIAEIVPPWAKGMPVKANGWVGVRYRKD